jgi:hypothetical protein
MYLPTENIANFELLIAEDYCDRLQISNSTLYDWKNNGVLIAGAHYIKKGGIVRYIWELNTIKSIGEMPNAEQNTNDKPESTTVCQ